MTFQREPVARDLRKAKTRRQAAKTALAAYEQADMALSAALLMAEAGTEAGKAGRAGRAGRAGAQPTAHDRSDSDSDSDSDSAHAAARAQHALDCAWVRTQHNRSERRIASQRWQDIPLPFKAA